MATQGFVPSPTLTTLVLLVCYSRTATLCLPLANQLFWPTLYHPQLH